MRNHDMVIIESIIAKANRKIFENNISAPGDEIIVNGIKIATSKVEERNYVTLSMDPLFDYCGTMQFRLVVNCDNRKYDLHIVDETNHINDIMFKKFEIYIANLTIEVA